jgi:hypothetical protein
VLVLATVSATASAQSASQSVTIIIEEVNTLSVAADVPMPAAPDRSAPAPDTAPIATYAFSTNGYGKKITGQLGAGFMTDLALDVALAAPVESGSSTGSRTLDSASAVDLVTGLSRVTQSGLGVHYSVTATDDARSASPGQSQTVTFTVTDR